MAEQEAKEEHQPESTAPVATDQPDTHLPASRRGKRSVTTWVPLDVHRWIRLTAAEDDTSKEQVLIEAITCFGESAGKHRWRKVPVLSP